MLAHFSIILALALIVVGCGSDDTTDDGLDNLQMVGIDFELNSIILTNAGSEDLPTVDVWIYQNGESFMLDIFTIEPRSTILFSLRELGGLDPAGGEVALYRGNQFDDPESIIDYVVWGSAGHDRLETARANGNWSEAGPIELSLDTLVLVHADPLLDHPDAWEASSEVP